jgi:hypothetical protein
LKSGGFTRETMVDFPRRRLGMSASASFPRGEGISRPSSRSRRSPQYWRRRAEMARATAGGMSDPQARASMEEAARHYDFFAELAERRRQPL